MKKVHVNLTVHLYLKMEEDAKLDDIINELDYDFTDTTGDATVEDTEIRDFEVEDSR